MRAIVETGGKNAIIVTANAELDETVTGILESAFGHAGQKCSAASRILVDAKVKGKLLERLKGACLALEVGSSFRPSCAINPLISREDQDRLQGQVKLAIQEANQSGGRVILDRSQESESKAHCVGPVLIELPLKQALRRDSLANKELFGPLLHLVALEEPEEAISAFNGTDYGLTGGVYGQSQDTIDFYTSALQAGNLYINRNITGARVGIEPFGGMKMSGTGPKAGGRFYLPAFQRNTTWPLSPSLDKEEEGEEGPFSLMPPDFSSPTHKRRTLLVALEILQRHFDTLFEGSHGFYKNLFQDFESAVRQHFLGWLNRSHPSVKIPGQLSYSDFAFFGGQALVASAALSPSPLTLLRTISAWGVGVGVSVMARNRQSYGWWVRLSTLLRQGSLDFPPTEVCFASESNLREALSRKELQFVIVDGSMEFAKKVGQALPSPSRHFVALLSESDPPPEGGIQNFFLEFLRERAFAVKTLRHGAPFAFEWEDA